MRRGELGDAFELSCPAKLNLLLQIQARRSDGYHELETLMVPVAIFDTLEFRSRSEERISLRCRWAAGLPARDAAPMLPEGPANLAWRAAERLREAAGVSAGAALQLTKRIPAAAGLGGASSDAAGVLLAANRAWGLHWPQARLAELAAELGSDVPFFLRRRPAIARGRGERLEELRLPRMHFVIVKPAEGLSTAEVYGRLSLSPMRSRRGAVALAADLAQGDAPRAARTMNNDLEPPARELSGAVEKTLEALQGTGMVARMSGSGTACFAWCRTAKEARRAARRLRAMRAGEVHAAASL